MNFARFSCCVALLAPCLLMAPFLGCERPNAGAAASSTRSQRGEPDHTYVVRARVEMMPESGKPTSEFVVHHEAIPEFVGFTGIKGMESMSMPFPLAKGLSLDGLGLGDPVEVTFVVWMTPGHRGFEARGVRKLPSSTRLNFEPESGTR